MASSPDTLFIRAKPAAAQVSSTAAMDWSQLTPRQRLAMLDLMQSTIQAELDRHVAEMNRELNAQGCPAELDIEVHVRIDPNHDPRLGR